MEVYYVCNNCRRRFAEPKQVRTTYESYYGVASIFPNGNALYVEECPYCGSDDIEEREYVEEDDDV